MGTDRTHTEESKGGTENWTKQWRFSINILRWSDGVNYLSHNTTTMNIVSLTRLQQKTEIVLLARCTHIASAWPLSSA